MCFIFDAGWCVRDSMDWDLLKRVRFLDTDYTDLTRINTDWVLGVFEG